MLIPDTHAPNLQLYGYSVDIDQDLIVVGAYFDMSVCNPIGDCSMGSANVFRREAGGWVFESKLFPANIAEETRYGKFVTISNGRAVVSASMDTNDAGDIRGGFYIFRREGTNWVDEARLTTSDIIDGSALRFRETALALDSDRLLISASTYDGVGVAYIFKRVGTTWTEEAKLEPPSSAPVDLTGSKVGPFVDLAGDVAVVAGTQSNAFVYRRIAGVWSFDTTLSDPDIDINTILKPTSVNTDGKNVLVTTIYNNAPNPGVSTFNIFQRNSAGWSIVSKLQPSVDIIASNQGVATSMKGGLITIGARLPGSVDYGETSSVYVFNAPATPADANAIPVASTWGIATMALILMTVATWIVRHRTPINKPLALISSTDPR